MTTLELVRGTDHARALVLSMRGAVPELSRCLTHEFEDVIAAVDQVDLVTFDRSLRGGPTRQRINRGLRRISGGALELPSQKLRPTKDYELVFVVVQDPEDLQHLGPLEDVVAAGKHSICFIEELWAHQIPERMGELRRLKVFDQIAVGCVASVEPLAKALDTGCFYMPPGSDAIVFHPTALDAPRPIDIYWMGRRSPETHRELVQSAAQRDWFYLFDTFGPGRPYDSREHRRQLGGLIKRSKVFFANKAKADREYEIKGQHEVGFRFFEGSAGGAVMVGDPPKTEAFQDLFGWEDAVIELPFHSTNATKLLADLYADTERMRRASANNLMGSLRKHDWAHRWARVLDAAAMPRVTEHDARLAQLEEMATSIQSQLETKSAVVTES